MFLSLRWLNKFLESGLGVDRLVETLTMAGLEVESVRDLGMRSGKIVIAKVLEVAKHPNADKLHLVKADIGAEKPAAIVCGAANVRVGMVVPCALPGADLPGGLQIKKAKIRGEASEGMLCSAKELEFGSDHSGILELAEDLTPGEPFDCILEIKVTPNRADCLSVIGVARDLAAMLGKKKTYPTTYRFAETLGLKNESFVNVDIEERGVCPRYTCRYIKGVKIGPSPLWLARALEASGLRPINNVVDVTNYVMLELGIPLHAFDYAQVSGGKIVVRFAQLGETLVTIDGRTIELHHKDLVIADAEKPIALAGIMGGKNTQVTETTANVILECAYFNPAAIRRTAKRHGIQTDSSYRFERGVDRSRVHASLQRATQLLHEVAHADVARGYHDVQATLTDETLIHLNLDRLNHLLGLKLTSSDAADRLVNLGFEIRSSQRTELHVAPPGYRVDIKLEVDLIEEVARVYGYDKIPETMPGIHSRPGAGDGGRAARMRAAKNLLADLGFSEAVHFSFISDKAVARHGYDPAAFPTLANPLTTEQTTMRPTLLPELLKAASRNQRQGAEKVALFEIGKTFKPGAQAGRAEDEGLSLALVLEGAEAPHWARPSRRLDFYDLKGVLERLAASLGLGEPRLEAPGPEPVYHPGKSAQVFFGGEAVGAMGELHPDMTSSHPDIDHLYDLQGNIYLAELDFGKILDLAGARPPRFQAIPKFPFSQRDLALVVDAELKAERLVGVAAERGKPLVEEVAVVDVYTGEHVAAGKKSVALSFRLRKPDATLTDEEINSQVEKILAGLAEECGAVLRA